MEDAGSWKRKLIGWVLFYPPVSWLSDLGMHFRRLQNAHVFGNEITFMHIIGKKKIINKACYPNYFVDDDSATQKPYRVQTSSNHDQSQ